MTERITVRFGSGEALEAALAELRRSGAVSPGPELFAPAGVATVHFSVRPADACRVRAIVRRAGGRITGP